MLRQAVGKLELLERVFVNGRRQLRPEVVFAPRLKLGERGSVVKRNREIVASTVPGERAKTIDQHRICAHSCERPEPHTTGRIAYERGISVSYPRVFVTDR